MKGQAIGLLPKYHSKFSNSRILFLACLNLGVCLGFVARIVGVVVVRVELPTPSEQHAGTNITVMHGHLGVACARVPCRWEFVLGSVY